MTTYTFNILNEELQIRSRTRPVHRNDRWVKGFGEWALCKMCKYI